MEMSLSTSGVIHFRLRMRPNLPTQAINPGDEIGDGFYEHHGVFHACDNRQSNPSRSFTSFPSITFTWLDYGWARLE